MPCYRITFPDGRQALNFSASQQDFERHFAKLFATYGGGTRFEPISDAEAAAERAARRQVEEAAHPSEQPASPAGPDPRIGELMAIIETQALHMQKLEARFEKLKSELAGV